MASLEYFWEDIPKPKYPRHLNTFTNGYIKVVHQGSGASVRLTVPFLNAVALNENQLKYTNNARYYYQKFWMLGRLLEIQEHNWLARDLVYQRFQFGFGHPTLDPESVERLPESEEVPVKDEVRDTEAAPISESAKDLKAPLLMPNYTEMNFRTYQEVIPIVRYFLDAGEYKIARELFGSQNEQGPVDSLGWLVPPGYVYGERYESVEYENRPHAAPYVRKRYWIAGWDREQLVLANKEENIIFWLPRRELVNGHKLNFLKPTFGRSNVYDYL